VGKTTTIRMLITLLKPMTGRITVFGTDTRAHPMRVRRMIGYVPQLLSADGSLTGRENVELFARLFDVPRADRRQRVDQALAAMGLAEPAPRLVKTYSGGMVRRLELAQALVNAPQLLVLDEPTVGLDPIARADVWEHISRLRERAGMTVLMTTHHMGEADLYCDRIALMHRGRVQATDTPGRLKARLGPDATLDDVFRHFTGGTLDSGTAKGGMRDVRSARRTARRLG
jgi:ABC-2 type transport system ATP-binding protein